MDGERARRRAEREMVAAYHKEQLASLLEHVRQGFDRLAAGEIDEFEMDELIHHYSRSAKELWKSAATGATGSIGRCTRLGTSETPGPSPIGGRSGAQEDANDRCSCRQRLLPPMEVSNSR